MAVTSTKYTSLATDLLKGNIDFLNDTIKVLLTTSSYTPSAAHDFVNDITNELAVTGYARQTLGTKTVSGGVANAANTTFGPMTATPKYAVVFKDTGNDATSPLICYIDLDNTTELTSDSAIIDWNDTDGIIKVS